MLVDTNVKNEPAAAEQLDALDELVLQHGPVRLVLHQVPEALDPGPRVARLLPDAVEVALHDLDAARQGRPGDDAQAELGVVGRVALTLARLPEGDAPDPRHLGQGGLPAGAVGGARLEVVLAVRLDEDEAEQRGRRGRRLAVLVDRALAAEGVLRAAPGEGVVLGGRVEVDVGVDDGEDELVVGHGCEV